MAATKTTRPPLPPQAAAQTKRAAAKAGMAISLGTLVATGLMANDKDKALKSIHIWSGFALVGFSYWHYSLYQKK